MKIMNKIVMGSVLLALVLSSLNFQYVAAAAGDPDDEVAVDGDTVKKQIQAHERVQFQFRKRTQLTIESDVNTTVDIECDAKDIGDKDVQIEVDADDDEDIELEMVCTEEQKELGLQNGNTYQARNRNRYRYQEGFCMEIKCNDSCEAKLKMEATEENQNGQWAYYDDDEEEWVTVDTELKDGYLVAETDHFSTWTVLIPEDYTLIIVGVGIGVAVLVAVIVIVMKRRK